MPAIDLNSDLGESYGIWKLGDDAAMLDLVTSANVACGFHAGDPSTLRRVCQQAADRGVAIGAQVSYPDLVGFGRRFIDIDPQELRDAVLYQLGALDGFAQVAGTGVQYVKPHGALYHACISHPHQAEAVAQAAHEYDPSLAVLGAPGSALLAVADALGMEPVPEAFADREYLADGRLVPRSEPGAVITDPAQVAARAVSIATERSVTARDGTVVPVAARSICIHGDTPGAVGLARAVRCRARGRRRRDPPLHGLTMRVLPMGRRALLIDEIGEHPVHWALGFDALHLDGVVDVVPAARTVLVTCTDAEVTRLVRSRLDEVLPITRFRTDSVALELPVRYDGPDLADVAELCGLAVDEVITRHAAAVYNVDFCGFAPGFGYLSGLDPALHVPRRATPRTAVPAGSLAIAAGYTAVYPRQTPGGWQLLGTVDAELFDPERTPPALFEPGTTVRFVPEPAR